MGRGGIEPTDRRIMRHRPGGDYGDYRHSGQLLQQGVRFGRGAVAPARLAGRQAEGSVCVVAPADGEPGLPGDAEDDQGDRQADQGVGDAEAECDDHCARDHREADVGVGAGVVAVGDQRRAVEAVAPRECGSVAATQLPP